MNEKTFTFSLSQLTAIITGLADGLRISDLNAAANQFTIPFDTVNQYVHGNGVDIEVTEKLIAFFSDRLS